MSIEAQNRIDSAEKANQTQPETVIEPELGYIDDETVEEVFYEQEDSEKEATLAEVEQKAEARKAVAEVAKPQYTEVETREKAAEFLWRHKFNDAEEAANKADPDAFKKLLESRAKEDRRQKAAGILQRNDFSEVAKVVLGQADPRGFFKELQKAARSDRVYLGIKEEWIYPLINEIKREEALQALEDWAEKISGATCVLNDDASNEDAATARDALQDAWEVDLRPHLVGIEEIINSGEYPEIVSSLCADYREVAEAVVSANNAEAKSKAWTLVTRIRSVFTDAIEIVFDQMEEVVSTSKATETQQRKEARPNAEVERRARQLQRAQESLAMKGNNPGVAKFGAGKKSKRAENDPHKSGK